MKKWFVLEVLQSTFFERGIWILFFFALNFSVGEVAILQTVFSITVAILEISTGMLSDIIGRRRVMIYSEISMLIYYLIFIFSQNFTFFIIGHIFMGIAFALASGNNFSFMYEDVSQLARTEDKMNKFIGKTTFLCNATLGLSIIMGGLLFTFNVKAPFIAAFIIRVVTLIIVLIFFHENKERPKTFLNFRSMIKNETYLLLKSVINFINKSKYIFVFIIILALYSSVIVGFDLQTQVLLDENNIVVEFNTIIQAIMFFIAAMANLLFAKLNKQFNYKSTVSFIIITSVLMLTSLIIFRNETIMICIMILLNILWANVEPLFDLKINRNVTDNIRATINSISSAAYSIFISAIFLIISLLEYRIHNLYTSIIVVFIFVSILFLILHKAVLNKVGNKLN